MVRQLMGQYRVKSPDLKPLYQKATGLLAKLPAWKIGHVYRAENARADELANMAMDAKRDVILASITDFKEASALNRRVARFSLFLGRVAEMRVFVFFLLFKGK